MAGEKLPHHKKEIDWAKVELFVKSGSPQKRIAEAMGIDEDTLRARVKERYGKPYSAFSAELYSEGNALLEAKQYQKAMEGNTPMLILLGRIRLGQKELAGIDTMRAANQDTIDKDHLIMTLQHRLAEVEAQLNGNQPKTE